MIRNILNFLLLLAFTNLSYSQSGNITIKEIRGYNQDACWFCPGKIVVSNGKQTDTISGGQHGNPPNYKILNIHNKKLLVLENDYRFHLGETIKSIQILALENHKFLELIFNKEIRMYRETMDHDVNGKTVFFVYQNNPTVKISSKIEITNNISYEMCPEPDDEPDFKCTTIFNFDEKNSLDLKLLLLD
jgi:hypothetical protein